MPAGPGKYGCFSEPTYIGVGDPYAKPRTAGGRDQGLNFKATLTKTGKVLIVPESMRICGYNK
jgi:hypothetical protein